MAKAKEVIPKKPRETDEEIELDQTEETDSDEGDEEEAAPVKTKAKKIDIMDPSDSNEPPKKKPSKFENKMDLSPVIEAINGLGAKLTPKKEKAAPKEESKESGGFTDILGQW